MVYFVDAGHQTAADVGRPTWIAEPGRSLSGFVLKESTEIHSRLLHHGVSLPGWHDRFPPRVHSLTTLQSNDGVAVTFVLGPDQTAIFIPTLVAVSLCEIGGLCSGVSTRLHSFGDWYTRVHTWPPRSRLNP